MKERPILFSGSMVRAVLSDQKKQTRRIVKPQFEREPVDVIDGVPSWDAPTNYDGEVQMNTVRGKPCPHGQPSDHLYVRETWAQPTTLDPGPTIYRADYPDCVPAEYINVPPVDEVVWRPSIHMPKALSRIMLEITGVWVERLQDISEANAIAEGVNPAQGLLGEDDVIVKFTMDKLNVVAPVARYVVLWESINGGGSWAANPFVWVISFKRIVS